MYWWAVLPCHVGPHSLVCVSNKSYRRVSRENTAMSSSLHKVFSSSLDEINNGLRKEFVTYDIFREISSFKNEKFKKGITLIKYFKIKIRHASM